METARKIIVYDNNCPMCQAYTKGFVKWGVLSAQNRVAFCELNPQQAGRYLDVQRSRHEIPLIDLAGGETLYGVDAMTYLIGRKIPFIGTLMRNAMVHRFFKNLYSFISYNRRVITATTPANSGLDCTPDFHLKHRLAFIAFALAVSSWVSWGFGISAGYYFAQASGWAMGGLPGLALLAAMAAKRKTEPGNRNIVEHAGQLAVVMLTGALLLLPGIFLDTLANHQNPIWLAASALVSLVVMGSECVRRIKYLTLNANQTGSLLLAQK